MSTGRYYRLYPTNTSDSASVYGMDTVASGQASFVVEQGINGASCALFSNSSNSGLPSSTVAGSWVPDSRYNLSFPKSFNYYYYLNLATANGKVLGQPVCFAPNGYVSNFKTVYGSGGSNHLWLTNSDKSIRGSSALIYFGGFSGKPTIILIDRDYTIIPNDADGFPKI
ncbi:MAG: hypothetical protein HC778_03365 [Chamaesiphon sp. CSU_1_12]|nr:hypothetical protein [Chamaesiphon sp. CSU_1_12]